MAARSFSQKVQLLSDIWTKVKPIIDQQIDANGGVGLQFVYVVLTEDQNLNIEWNDFIEAIDANFDELVGGYEIYADADDDAIIVKNKGDLERLLQHWKDSGAIEDYDIDDYDELSTLSPLYVNEGDNFSAEESIQENLDATKYEEEKSIKELKALPTYYWRDDSSSDMEYADVTSAMHDEIMDKGWKYVTISGEPVEKGLKFYAHAMEDEYISLADVNYIDIQGALDSNYIHEYIIEDSTDPVQFEKDYERFWKEFAAEVEEVKEFLPKFARSWGARKIRESLAEALHSAEKARVKELVDMIKQRCEEGIVDAEFELPYEMDDSSSFWALFFNTFNKEGIRVSLLQREAFESSDEDGEPTDWVYYYVAIKKRASDEDVDDDNLPEGYYLDEDMVEENREEPNFDEFSCTVDRDVKRHKIDHYDDDVDECFAF